MPAATKPTRIGQGASAPRRDPASLGAHAAPTMTLMPVGALKRYGRNSRRHSDKQIDLIVRSIREFGFVNPVLIDKDDVIIAGHGRYDAALRSGMEAVPTVRLEHLTTAQVTAYRIADNRIADLSDWDPDLLRLEIADLVEMEIAGDLEFDVSVIGFGTAEIDVLLDDGAEEGPEILEAPGDEVMPVSRAGDLWVLGAHRLYCGDALLPGSYAAVMGAERARMVFADPPYNVPVVGHVRTTKDKGHREFAMGVGEMSSEAFCDFLGASIAASRDVCLDGAVLMICMDWRHIQELIAAGTREKLALINLCVWVKTNGGMGSLYRSQHEMVCIFKSGRAPHVNNVELGRHGRYRTNAWTYSGVNTFRKGRAADLADHPTVKPTALVADAIKDVTHRGEIVLDPFGGSGSTLLAAEKTGRRARLIELDPLYVDVAVRRWQTLTGQAAVLAANGETFDGRQGTVLALQAENTAGAGEVGHV